MLKYVKPLHYSKVKAVCLKNIYSEKSALFLVYHYFHPKGNILFFNFWFISPLFLFCKNKHISI